MQKWLAREKGKKQVQHDLILLCTYTGMRQNEACSLLVSDVESGKKCWWLSIREGKNRSAVRDVPVTAKDCIEILKRRTKGRTSGQLFEELRPGGKDDKLNWRVGKALRYSLNKVMDGKAKDECVDFHSTRRTYASVLENGGLRKDGYDHHAIAQCGDPEVSEEFMPIVHLV
ncbi:MAG: hypothetical protein CMM10_05770, partial [Rhodospirillaceae bacterium]|nr:hypothetical protein [Rhodospirillaceae bacterium]